MKRKNILVASLLTLLSISTFAGCTNNVNTENNNSINSGLNIITPVLNQTLESESKKLEDMLNSLRNGLKIEGVIKEKLNLLDGFHGNYIGNTMNVTYNAEYIYEVGEENGYSAYVTYQEEGYPVEEFIDNQVFEGEDGYAYFDELDYDNKIKTYPVYDYQSGGNVNFGYYCLNPFSYLIPDDFTKTGDNTYELSKGKASFLASNIFGDIDGAFQGVIEKCEFVVENNQFKSFSLVPTKFHSSFTDYESLSSIYYYADFSVEMNFKDVGSAKVERIQPRVACEETAALQAAFEKFKNKNYTAFVHAEYFNDEDEKEGENFEYTYYDGEEVYMSFVEDQTVHDEVNNSYCQLGKNGILSVVDCTYDEIVPKMSEIDASIFDYNAEEDVYSICDEMVSYICAIAILPRITNLYILVDGFTTKCDIKLDENGYIDYIDIETLYEYALSTEFGKVRVEFYDIDNTRIPHNLKTYEE